METRHLVYLNALNHIALYPKKFFSLLKLFNNNPYLLWNAPVSQLIKYNISSKTLENFTHVRQRISPEEEFEKLLNHGITVIPHPAFNDNTLYPELLTHIWDPPPVLYAKGNISLLNHHQAIAVVGSRKISEYGRKITEKIAHLLAINNILVISGLAVGVDCIAHQSALQAKKPTIAVLAHGLDIVYPKSNTKIVQQILSLEGTIISEFPLGTPPLKQYFPQRNRIISGISSATIITEAALKSGSLITAYHALQQNRDIFAVPGEIFSPMSAGTNYLIAQGATPIISIQNLLEILNLPNIPTCDTKEEISFTNNLHRNIYKSLSTRKTLFIDDLFKKINAPAQEINSALTVLELQGLVRNVGGGQYIRN